MSIHPAWLLAFFFAITGAEGSVQSDHVVVLANSREDGSLALARYYATERGIPDRNVIALPMSAEETITWAQYVDEVHRPLLARLVADGWIGAEIEAETDRAGRALIALQAHGISFLVTCRGVPLRIENDPVLLEAEGADLPPRYRTNQSAVDSELSLLTRSNPPTTGVITNPLYRQRNPSTRRMVSTIRVARLDGPSWTDCYRLVDSAAEGEKRGLIGRVYLDATGSGQEGDQWLAAIADRIALLGYDLEQEQTGSIMGLTDRMDGTALYFGWHLSKAAGPFLNGSPFFEPGAVAVHIYSFSAGSLRHGWSAAMVRAGAAATLGNVYEPYLQLTHNLALFFEVLEDGGSVGEAAWYALPGQSWQGILVGDPLYRPFAKGFEAQWENRDAEGFLSPYLVLRAANRAQTSGGVPDAIQVLEKEWERLGPDLALAWRLVDLAEDEERRHLWFGRLAETAFACELPPDRWGLALAVADRLARDGRWSDAMRVGERLLEVTIGSAIWSGVLLERMESYRVETGPKGKTGSRPEWH